MQKADFLRECMSDVGQAPLDVFQKAFCSVCANRDCARSSSNNLMFDRRVLNWKKDLFDNVPRADDSDPRFAQIRSKRFVSPEGAPPPAEPPRQQVVWHPTSPEPAEAPPHSGGPPEGAPEASPGAPGPAPAPEPVRAPQASPGLGNTPFAQGTVLPGGPAGPGAKDVEVEPGGSFTFGGGDE